MAGEGLPFLLYRGRDIQADVDLFIRPAIRRLVEALEFAGILTQGLELSLHLQEEGARDGGVEQALRLVGFPKLRMAAVDRNVLRGAVAEFLGYPDTPKAVVINEALEIARKYSSPESVTFINGVLDSVGKELDQAAGSRLHAPAE